MLSRRQGAARAKNPSNAHGLPAQPGQKLNGGLFDQGVFGVVLLMASAVCFFPRIPCDFQTSSIETDFKVFLMTPIVFWGIPFERGHCRW